jgi:predicted AAA+ superfamily ATPase
MINRKIIKDMLLWKNRASRKPLVLRGARQVGKTSVVRMLGEGYTDYIELNLEILENRQLFQRELPIKDLWQAILLTQNRIVNADDCLLFIDEIQNSPAAIAYLRYFHEDLPHVHVIGAGSLLEIRMGRKQISFPVGRVEFLYLHPLSFIEYLQATGNTQLAELIETVPFPSYALETALKQFHRYTLIGGMPEIVRQYIQDQDISSLTPLYHGLLQTYMDDVEKYAPSSTKVIRHCIETAPYEAAKRIKFAGFGQSNYKSRDISEALKTLEQAMLIRLLYPTTSVELPAQRNRKKSPRLQFLDTGLINHAVGLQGQFFEHSELHALYRGLLAEHIVGQELLCHSQLNTEPLFWVREKRQSTAEVDYLIQHKGRLVPLEVKAGKSGTLKSLHQFIEHSDCPHAIRLYGQDVSVTQAHTQSKKPFTLLNMPYFLASQVDAYIDAMLG